MEEKIVGTEPEIEQTPKSLDEVLASLRGFGIEEVEEILTISVGGRICKLRISNIPTEQETLALMAAEEYKGHSWVQHIKCELLSRAITWVDGISISGLKPEQRVVTDPTDNIQKDIQVVLRNIILSWGIEVTAVLWKVLMVHAQNIEDRLANDFPDSTILTEVEKRIIATATKEIEDANRSIVVDTMKELYREEGVELPGDEPKVQ